MYPQKIEFKPFVRRLILVRMAEIAFGLIALFAFIQLLNLPLHWNRLIISFIGSIIGISIAQILISPFFKIGLTSYSISGPSSWGKYVSIPIEKIDFEASQTHNTNVRFFQNYRIIATSGEFIMIQREYSAAQINDLVKDLMARKDLRYPKQQEALPL